MPETTISNAAGDAQAIVDIARQASGPFVLEDTTVYAFQTPEGVQVIDGRAHGPWPIRKAGHLCAFNAKSFSDYVLEQSDGVATKIWVDEHKLLAQAVLNGHSDRLPGFGDHTISLVLKPTESWQAWLATDGQLMDQTRFAELIEDNAADVVNPTGAVMLEIAQSFQATTKVSFESSKYLADGRRALEYREDTAAKAGHKGALEIPTEFHLGLRPFFGAEVYRVTARFRYRITDGALRIGYKLTRPADVQRAAFGDIVGDIRELLGDQVAVFAGTPS